MSADRLELTPIGVARTPFQYKEEAPRQPAVASGVRGTIELFPEAAYEHGLEGLEGFSHLWLLFWFHHNTTWKAKVMPPRSEKKRGVFATRSPHRPNPLGLSVVRLLRIEGRVLHVEDVDLLDGTPIFDIKPYVAYTDAVPAADSGWLARPDDPGVHYAVTWSDLALEQLAWLAGRAPLDLKAIVEQVLTLGPTPHPYRRIKQLSDHSRLGVKDFRVRFTTHDRVCHVLDIDTGYKKSVLANPQAQPTEQTPLEVHRGFVARFGG
jgi:tRNA (adenine37-N6)-methyltransferase